MLLRTTLAFAACMLSANSGASACQHARPVVAIQYTVGEQLPERVETSITNPLEKLLVDLPRLADVHSVTGHGAASFELQFEGGATEADLAAVKGRVEGWRAHDRIEVLSARVVLTTSCLSRWPWQPTAPHRHDQSSPGRH